MVVLLGVVARGSSALAVLGLVVSLPACGRLLEIDLTDRCSPEHAGGSCDSGRPSGDGATDAGEGSTPDATTSDANRAEAGNTDAQDSGPGNDSAAYNASVPTFLVNPAHTSSVIDAGVSPPLARLWAADLGDPVSYPLIAQGLIYVATGPGSSPATSRVLALDPATGAIAWSASPGDAVTIAYDDGRVFAVDATQSNGSGHVRAYDATTGKVLWTTSLDSNQSFFDAPPVAYRGALFFSGSGTDGTLYAYDEASGSMLWSESLPSSSEGSPAVSDQGVFVFTSCGDTRAFDRSTGGALWQTASSECTSGMGTPVLYDGGLYVLEPTASNERIDLTSRSPAGTFASQEPPAFGGGMGFVVDGGVLFGDPDTLTTTKWTFAPEGMVGAVPLVADGWVYVASTIGNLYAVDVSTGKSTWSQNVGGGFVYIEAFTTEPRVGLAAGGGVLLVPMGNSLVAYASTASVDGGPRTEQRGDASCVWDLTHAATVTGTPDIPAGLGVADLNGDGHLDLVTAGSYAGGQLDVRLGNGNGTFQAASVMDFVADGVDTLATGDVNGDGKVDVALASTYGKDDAGVSTVSILLGNGDGTMGAQVSYPTDDYPEQVLLSDLNGDGDLDLCVATGGNGGLDVLLNRGDGTFSPSVAYAKGHGLWAVATGDLNGDKKPDLVTAYADSAQAAVLLNGGDGGVATFSSPTAIALPASPRALAVGDVNGDGKLDLVAVGSEVYVLLGKGDGTFGSATTYAAGTEPSAVAIGDLDGDGHPDLVVTNGGSGSVSVLFGNGDGTFQWQVVFATDTTPTSLAIDDFNGDGKRDVAVCNSGANSITVLLGACN